MFEVVIARDDDAGHYYVCKSDIIGLHAEADSLDELVKVIEDVAPELIEANHKPSFFRTMIRVFTGQKSSGLRITRELSLA